MLLLLSTEPLVWDRASHDQTGPQEPPEDASSKPSDPSAAACGPHPGSWPRPLWRAVLGGGSALAPEAPQMHQLQDCSAAPAPLEHVLGTSRRTSSSAEQPNETRWSIPSVTSAVLEEPSMRHVAVENIFVTRCWQSLFSPGIRTDAKTLAFLLSSPFPSRTRLECADRKLAQQLTL